MVLSRGNIKRYCNLKVQIVLTSAFWLSETGEELCATATIPSMQPSILASSGEMVYLRGDRHKLFLAHFCEKMGVQGLPFAAVRVIIKEALLCKRVEEMVI